MSSLYIVPIASEEELRREAVAEDLEVVAHFASEHRRREALAWRGVVRRELGSDCKIGYDEWGAPTVDTAECEISVSHCDKFVAVLISDRHCGVDIESLDRNFARIASRYMSDEEKALSADKDWAAMAWSAKEALYKLHRKGGIDFLKDIKIESYDATSQLIKATIPYRCVEVQITQHEGYIVASIG